MFSLPAVEALTSVSVALRWLLEIDPAISTEDVLLQAHQRNVIDSIAGPHWKANDQIVDQLLRLALRRPLQTSKELGVVLHGIGELSARSHAKLGRPVRAFLRAHRHILDPFLILDAAASIDERFRRPASLEGLAASQWITNARLGWADLQAALGKIQHPWHESSGVFGFAFVAKAVLRIDRLAVDRWVTANPHKLALASVGAVLAGTAMKAGALTPMLKSSVPAFRLIAAAALVSPVFPPANPLKVRDVVEALTMSGFDAGDAVWITGHLIKEALHSRYRIEDGRDKSMARRNHLERNPQEAFGGHRNADSEKTSLDRRLAELNAQHEVLLPAFEQMLVELAEGWPQDGLTAWQLVQLENIFVDTAEIRFRLAEKLPHASNRNWLLDKNIERVRSFLGATRPSEAFHEQMNSTEQFATRTSPWTAQSFVLRFGDDARGVGRRTSNFINALTNEAESLLNQPFFAARAPMVWQSASTRAACAFLLALMVVAAMPEPRRTEVEKLNQMAIDHVHSLLSLPLPTHAEARLFDRLAASAVYQMAFYETAAELKKRWALSGALGVFPRALTLWSSPDLVDQYPKLAADLFKRVGSLPLHHGALDRQISNLLSLLDCAVASCANAGRRDLLDQLTRHWAVIYVEWLPVSERWANAASDFIAAIDADGPERANLCADPAFATTCCRRLIEASQSPEVALPLSRDVSL